MATLDEYELMLDGMGRSPKELKATEGWPAPIAVGYLRAARKVNGGKRADANLGDIFGDMFGSVFKKPGEQ